METPSVPAAVRGESAENLNDAWRVVAPSRPGLHLIWNQRLALVATATDPELARRIAACLNFCGNFDTELLEACAGVRDDVGIRFELGPREVVALAERRDQADGFFAGSDADAPCALPGCGVALPDGALRSAGVCTFPNCPCSEEDRCAASYPPAAKISVSPTAGAPDAGSGVTPPGAAASGDPLSIACPYCHSGIGVPCRAKWMPNERLPHFARIDEHAWRRFGALNNVLPDAQGGAR